MVSILDILSGAVPLMVDVRQTGGSPPIEVSSGSRATHRLSRRGFRQLNHAIHMVAICQIRQTDSEGRAYFEKKVMEGKTKKDAIRSLNR
jgi:hypothetical protein